MLRTLEWWRGIHEWQLTMILAAIYLAWWTIDRYHRSNQKMIATLESSFQKFSKEINERMDARDKLFNALTIQCDKDKAEVDTIKSRISLAGIK
jgi:hypothetical protein